MAIGPEVPQTLDQPVADAGGPYSGAIGEPIAFDASGSYHPDGTIVGYRWDWTNDGEWDTGWLPDPNAVHAYDAGFHGQVALEVKDDQDATDSDTADVDINFAPVADAGGPYSGATGEPINFDGSGSNDPDGTIVGYRWDWTNDGSWDTDWLSEPNAVHSYGAEFLGQVALEVLDNEGATGADTANVDIANAPPIADAGGPYSGTVGEEITFDASGSHDPYGTIVAYRWDWTNDGEWDTDWLPDPNAVHVYESTFDGQVALEVIDEEDATGAATADVVIANAAPTADAGGPYSGAVGAPITFDASGSHDPYGTIVGYRWDWTNDGEWDTDWQSDPNATHTYDAIFHGLVRLEVKDDEEVTDEDVAAVHVTDPSGPATITYEYDSLNRLVRVTYASGAAILYEYDAVGNRTRRVRNSDVNSVHLSLHVDPPASGSVIRDPNMAWYPLGSEVMLTAVAEGTCEFVGWTGDVPPDPNDPNNLGNPCNPLPVTLDEHLCITAHFDSPFGHMDEDCNANSVPDGCEWADCNGNDVLDACDILLAHGGYCDPNEALCSSDYDLNGVPDECDSDCDGNGVPDACDINCGTGDCASHPNGCGTATDCQPNGIPDICDLDPNDPDGNGQVSADCQPNGIPDECDIFDCDPNDPACQDCNGNSIPDACDIRDCDPNDLACQDCQLNGVPDACDIIDCDPNDPACQDCQSNGVPDECDIANGTSLDSNGNGTPDECDCPGDLDGDFDVDLADLAQLLAHYGAVSGATYADGDMDFDGDVDLSDLAALLAVYGTTCE